MKKIIVDAITPIVINFKIRSFFLMMWASPLSLLSSLYCLDVFISAYVTNAVIEAMIIVSMVMEFVCITEPAKTGRMPHENIVDGLL